MSVLGRCGWVVLLGTAASCMAVAQDTVTPALARQIDQAAQDVLKTTGVPSTSVAVVQGGHVAYVKAYGDARLQPVLLAAPAMQYSIGSISKQFTAALILLLQQDGKLRLDDAVGKYVPGLTRGNEVTIREVLSMTSGYQDYWPEDYVMPSMTQPTTATAILGIWGQKPLDFEPGTRWEYSNTNYVIAGRIAEVVGGAPLMEQLQRRIFGPLGMTGVLNSDTARLPASDPTGYFRYALGPLRPAPLLGDGWVFAAGELAMTAESLAKWDISLIGRSLLSKESYDEMFTDVHLKNGEPTGYGLGVEVGARRGHRFISHSGEVSGFTAENMVLPDDQAAVVVLTNQDASDAAGELANDVGPMLYATAKDDDAGKAEAQAKGLLEGLQEGRLDRSQLTAYCNAYFSAEALADFKSSLQPLGAVQSVRETQDGRRGGMRFRAFEVRMANGTIRVTEFEEPDGKLEQFLIVSKD